MKGEIRKKVKHRKKRAIVGHVFRAKTSSSRKTRACAEIVRRAHHQQLSKKARNRANRKNNKLARLRQVPSSPMHLLAATKKSTIFLGRPGPNPVGIPPGVLTHVVPKKLEVVNHVGDGGAHYSGGKFAFTRIPREEAMKAVNPLTYPTFDGLSDKIKKTNNRGGKRAPISETGHSYTTFGTAPSRNTIGCREVLHGMDLDKATHAEVSRYFKAVEAIVLQYISSAKLRGLKAAKERDGKNNWSCFPLHSDSSSKKNTNIWASLSLGKNVFLPLHTDLDFWLSCTTVLTKQMSDEICNYFCFPEQGLAVAMRPGDLLIFDPTVPHCVSSRACDCDVQCMSFYLKTAVVGGNDNSQQLSEADKQKCAMFDSNSK